jgi:hypothetical protein
MAGLVPAMPRRLNDESDLRFARSKDF